MGVDHFSPSVGARGCVMLAVVLMTSLELSGPVFGEMINDVKSSDIQFCIRVHLQTNTSLEYTLLNIHYFANVHISERKIRNNLQKDTFTKYPLNIINEKYGHSPVLSGFSRMDRSSCLGKFGIKGFQGLWGLCHSFY